MAALTAGFAMAAAPAAPARHAAPRCKRGQTLVRLNGKRVCRRAASLFPAPRRGDPRAAFLKFAFGASASKAAVRRHRSHRHHLSARDLQASRRARAVVLRLLPRVLAGIDRRQPTRAPATAAEAAAAPRPLARAAACSPAGSLPSSTYSASDGGLTMTAQATGTGMAIGLDGGLAGYTIHFRYATSTGCNEIRVPSCPTASGEARAQGSSVDDVLVEIRKDAQVVSYTHVTGRRVTKAVGQNAADAKLDTVTIDDELSSSVTVQQQDIPRTTFSGSFRRRSVFDMRADRWLRDRFVVDVRGSISIDETVAAYSNLVHGIAARYRERERGVPGAPGWSLPGSHCASIDFTPASNSRTLRPGSSGTVIATIRSYHAGTAADGVTRVVAQSGGTLTPSPAKGGTPRLRYTVAPGATGALSASVEATSTAGAARGTWRQPIVRSDPPARISGSFSGRTDDDGGLPATWSGEATWIRAPALDAGSGYRYTLASAAYTVVVSGHALGCEASGTRTVTVPADPTVARFTILAGASAIFGSPDPVQGPYSYTWFVPAPAGQQHLTVALTNCAGGGPDQTIDVSTEVLPTAFASTTPDGVTFSYSRDAVDRSDAWSFAGSG